MATITRRGTSFQANITLPDGSRKRRAFKTERKAQDYIDKMEGRTDDDFIVNLSHFIYTHYTRLWGTCKDQKSPALNCAQLVDILGAKTPVPDITPRKIEQLIVQLQVKGLSNATINRKLSTLSKLLRHAERLEIITQSPVIHYLPEVVRRERTLTADEHAVICAYFTVHNPYMGYLVDFLLYTGCRLSEALKLSTTDVSYDHVTFSSINNKTGVTRIVPLLPQARNAYHAVVGYKLAKPFSKLSPHQIQYQWHLMTNALGFDKEPGFIIHMLRHTCATRLIQSGASIPTVMRWMGHKNVATTMRYTHLITKDLDEAADNLKETQ